MIFKLEEFCPQHGLAYKVVHFKIIIDVMNNKAKSQPLKKK
jgi:hypothetical protein